MPQKRKTSTQRRRKSKRRWWTAVVKHLPSWSFWLGGFFMLALFWLVWKSTTTVKIETVVDYPDGYTIYGIDVSRYQQIIDWDVLRNKARINGQPVRFVFIKATQGADRVDPRYEFNSQEALKYGIRRGAYHYYDFSSSPKAQAEWFIKHVSLREGDLPPVLDVETRPAGITDEAFKWAVMEWLSLVAKHYGVPPILYTYHSFKQQYLDDVIFEQYPYWIAHYGVDEVAYKGTWQFWQFSDKGSLPGIKGPVDLNVFNGTLQDLQRFAVHFE